jgi:hypothetical protein
LDESGAHPQSVTDLENPPSLCGCEHCQLTHYRSLPILNNLLTAQLQSMSIELYSRSDELRSVLVQ